MHTNNNKKYIFCGYQNILVAIISKETICEYKNIYFLFFITCFLPSIKNTNLDKIPPKNGTQNFSYKKFIIYQAAIESIL